MISISKPELTGGRSNIGIRMGAWLSGLAIIAATLVGVGYTAGVVAPQTAQAAEQPSGCNYGTGKPGQFANTVCWIDFTDYNEQQAHNAGQPFRVSIGGGYTASFTLTSKAIPNSQRPYRASSSFATSQLPGTGFAYSYGMAAGRPVLWNQLNQVGPPESGASGNVYRLNNIVVTGPDGAAVQDYKFVSGDSESTATGETVTFRSDKPLELIEPLSETSNGRASTGCFPDNTVGADTTTVTCTGKGAGGSGASGNELYGSTSPTFIEQTINSTSRNAGVFGVMMSKVELNKTVASRVNTADSFGLSIAAGNSERANASTGQASTGTTDPVTVLSGSELTLSEVGEGATELDRYSGVWSCAVNGVVNPALVPAAGATTLTLPPSTIKPGDFLECTITNTAQSASLSKTASVPYASPDDSVAYTVTVTNTGPVAYTAAKPAAFTDDLSGILDDASYNNDASDGATVDGNKLMWSGPLAVGESKTINYSVKVNSPDTGDKVLTNTVVPPPNSGIECGTDSCQTIRPVRTFVVSKTADKPVVTLGDLETFSVTATNTGKADYTADDPARFVDDLSGVLDDATYNGDASDGATVSENELSWSGALAVGESKTVTYSVTVNAPDQGDKLLRNVVTTAAAGGTCDPSQDASCRTETPVRTFVVSKTVDQTAVTLGEKLTYTVTVSNTGTAPYTAEIPATFSDNLSGVVDDAMYNADASDGATYADNTLSWSGPLAVGETKTVTYSVTVSTPDPGDKLLRNVVTTPTAGGGTCDPDPAASCQTETPVRTFVVSKTVDQTAVTPGGTLTYTVTVSNTGTAPYTDADPAVFTDDLSGVLDDSTYNLDATGGATIAATKLAWSGPLAVGETKSVTYSVTVNTPDLGDKLLRNEVSPAVPGGLCNPDPDFSCHTETPVGTYEVVKSTNATTAAPGQTIGYTITVTNTGTADYSVANPAGFVDDLSQVLDDAVYNGDATNGAALTDTKLSWSGPLGIGTSVTVDYSVTVNDPDHGDGTLTNVVLPNQPGGGCPTESDCRTITPPPAPPVFAGLASTGLSVSGWLSVVTALLIAGAALLMVRSGRLRRKKN